MSVVWTRRLKTRQPAQAPRINYGNPLARGITDAWVGSTPGATVKGQATSIQTAGSFSGGPGGADFLSVASGAKNGLRVASDFSTLFPSASAGTVVLCLRHTDTTLRAGITLGSEDNSDHGKRILLAAPFSDGNLYWDWGSFSTGGRLVISGYTKTTAVTTLVATAGPSAGRAVWRDGVLIGSAASSNSVVAFTKSFSLGSADISGTSESDATEFYMFAAYGRELSAAESASVSRNPWQLLAPERRAMVFGFAAAGAAAALEGSLAASGTVSGALTTAIQAAASVSASASVTAALSTAIRPAASVSASATVSAALTTAIQMAGSLSGTASVSGDISGAAALASSVSTSAIVTGALTTAIRLNASLSGAATVSATLTGGSSSIWTPASASSGTWTPASAAGGTWTAI